MSAIHEDHDSFSEMILVHKAWEVGGGGACTKKILLNGARFISHPGETVKTDSALGNSIL